MQRKAPPTGLLLLVVAFAAGGAGFLAGRESTPPAPARSPTPPSHREEAYAREEPPPRDFVEQAIEQAVREELPAVEPKGLIDALRGKEESEHAQRLMLGVVAEAALRGPAMYPEIRRLLDEGHDVTFKSYDGDKPGYPTLRVALLAAAEATGDPEAAALILDVAQTTQSPVELVFGAHLLDRLGALEPAIAQRTLDAFAQPLSEQQRKAIGGVARQVVAAAAGADPVYAESYLARQIRITEGPRADARTLAPILDGLPADRARAVVETTLHAPDVAEPTKALLAARAAGRSEIELLASLRRTMEGGGLSPAVGTAVARASVSGQAYGRLDRQARTAVKAGDFARAEVVAAEYALRLDETARVLGAADARGTPLPRDIELQARLHRQRLNDLGVQIRRAREKQQKQQGKAKGT